MVKHHAMKMHHKMEVWSHLHTPVSLPLGEEFLVPNGLISEPAWMKSYININKIIKGSLSVSPKQCHRKNVTKMFLLETPPQEIC
jgi:hypothetical protein